jgi:hypothetical protein
MVSWGQPGRRCGRSCVHNLRAPGNESGVLVVRVCITCARQAMNPAAKGKIDHTLVGQFDPVDQVTTHWSRSTWSTGTED